MVLTEEEKEYLDMFEKGEYIPSLLFYDNQILENIVEHPMAIWKMQLEQKVEMKFQYTRRFIEMEKNEIVKSEIGSEAAWRGFSTQNL